MKRIRSVNLLLGVIFISLCLSITSDGQSSPDVMLVHSESGVQIDDLDWTANSRYLVFQTSKDNSDRNTKNGLWRLFDRQTYRLQSQNIWPLLPQLTDVERSALQVGTFQGDDAFMSLSPNGQYLVYIEANDFNLSLADMQSMQSMITTFPAIAAFSDFDDFSINWSNDSTTSVVEDVAASTRTPLMYVIQPNAMDIKTSDVFMLTSISIAGTDYAVWDMFDLFSDGSRFLFSSLSNLVIWDQSVPSNSTIIDNDRSHIAAAFSPGNEQKVIAVRNDGLIEYDLNTGQETILRSDINSVRYKRALFSPDGLWLALVKEVDVATDALLVVDITNDLLSANPSCDATVPE